jgi:polyisoprenoid-binding protein YceI
MNFPDRVVLPSVLALAFPVLASAQASTWDLDPAHTHASFTVRHMGVSNVRGEFEKVTGKVVLDEKDVTRSTVEASIDAASIGTRVEKRDADLRSENFFDVAKHPTISFKSTKIEKAGGDKLKVTGDLTMHGVTKPVVLEVTGPTPPLKAFGRTVRGATATTRLNRKDWGLAYNALIEVTPIVGDEVNIDISVELVKQEAK